MVEVLILLLLFLLTLIFILSLKKIFPVSPAHEKYADSISKREREYKRWDYFGSVAGIISGLAGGYLSWLMCRLACAWRAGNFIGDHILIPQKGICLLPAVPAAIAAGIAGARLILRLMLKSRFSELEMYGSLKFGIDIRRFLRLIFIACLALTFLGIALPFNTYMVISEQDMRYNSLTDFSERRYEYSDVASIELVRKEKGFYKKDLFLEIHFKDKEIWKSENTAELPDRHVKILAEYISERAQVSVTEKQGR
ncbi:MAG: hypothetical protein M0P57_03180 [Syntrophales bacterium]|jgi:hypothetical protein|nr:hypothetical protein [Syntrophales bacterium]